MCECLGTKLDCDIIVYKDGCFLLQCLMMFQVPFMEDVRQYTFASLSGARKQFEPSGMLCTPAPLSTFTVYSTHTQGTNPGGAMFHGLNSHGLSFCAAM